jgi:hypothetical protein
MISDTLETVSGLKGRSLIVYLKGWYFSYKRCAGDAAMFFLKYEFPRYFSCG